MRYRIKSSPERRELLEVVQKNATGYYVRIIRDFGEYETVTESFMEQHLFEMCLKTGYLSEERDTAPERCYHREQQPSAAFSMA